MSSFFNYFQRFGDSITRMMGDRDYGFSNSEKGSEDESLFAHSTLSKYLYYQSYDPETQLFYLENSIGFFIEALPMVGSDFSVQKEFLGIFQEVMPEGSSIQCMLFADHRIGSILDDWVEKRSSAPEIFQKAAEKRRHHFKNDKEMNPRYFRFFLSYSEPIQRNNPLQTGAIREVKERILKTLNTFTHAFERNADDFLQLADGMLNFNLKGEVEEKRWDELNSLSSQMRKGGRLLLDRDGSGLQWKNEGSARFRGYYTVSYPQSWSLSLMQKFIGDFFRESYRVNTPFYIQFSVHCPCQEKAESANWMRTQAVENQGKSGNLLRMIPDLADELRDCDHVRRSLAEMDRFVWTQLGVGMWSEDDKINQHEQSLKGLFRLNGFTIAPMDCLHLPFLLSSLPMGWSEYVSSLSDAETVKTTISADASNLVPIQGEWCGTQTPSMLFVGRRGQILTWSPFDNNQGNYNCVVIGRSGSGKSVFMQELLMSSLGIGAKVFVLDVGRSYKKMCEMIEGQEIEFSLRSQLCLNPFSFISTVDREERLHSFSLVKSIISTMIDPEAGANKYENGLIEKGILASWEKYKTRTTITHIVEYLSEHEDPNARRLAVILNPFSKSGVYGRYFEGENNVNFNNPMVLIELEELKEQKDLQSVVLQLFIMTITTQAFLGDRETPFHICIDEAWDLLRGKQTGVFIETLARRLRKYKGSLVVGTQSVNDFFKTPGSQAAFENSDWMCLLSQKKSSISRFSKSEQIEMNPAKQKALESVHTKHGEYSEVMICDGEESYTIARLVLDPFSCLLYSTQPDDYKQLKKLQSQGLSISQAIEMVLHGSPEISDQGNGLKEGKEQFLDSLIAETQATGT